MHRVGARLVAHLDDLLDLEVALRRRAGADQVGLVGARDVQRVAVDVAVDGDDATPSSSSARAIRTAISPRLAIRTLENMQVRRLLAGLGSARGGAFVAVSLNCLQRGSGGFQA